MMVVMTSWTPRVALRMPAMKPMKAPAMMPATMPRTAPTMPRPPATYATQAPNIAPKISWPWPPMLNSPTRSGSTTARPVSTSGAVFCRVRVSPSGTKSASRMIVS